MITRYHVFPQDTYICDDGEFCLFSNVTELQQSHEQKDKETERKTNELFLSLSGQIDELHAKLAEKDREIARLKANFEKARQWNELTELELINRRSIDSDVEQQLATLTAQNEEMRTAIMDIVGHTMALAHGEPESRVWRAINDAARIAQPDLSLLERVVNCLLYVHANGRGREFFPDDLSGEPSEHFKEVVQLLKELQPKD